MHCAVSLNVAFFERIRFSMILIIVQSYHLYHPLAACYIYDDSSDLIALMLIIVNPMLKPLAMINMFDAPNN